MVLLKIAVKDNKLIKVKDTLMIEDTINGIKCNFEFRSDWSTLKKTVVFARGHIYPATQNPQTISTVLDNNDECIVPPEIVSEKGEFSIGLFGENDDARIVTNWLYYKTKLGCYDVGITPNPPTPTEYDQILEVLNHKSDIGHTHTADEVGADIKGAAMNAENNAKAYTDQMIRSILDFIDDGVVILDAGEIIERS